MTNKYQFNGKEIESLTKLTKELINNDNGYDEYENGTLIEFIKKEFDDKKEKCLEIVSNFWSINKYKGYILLLMYLDKDFGIHYKNSHFTSINHYIQRLIVEYPRYDVNLIDEDILIQALINENKEEKIEYVKRLFLLKKNKAVDLEIVKDCLINLLNSKNELLVNKKIYPSLIDFTDNLFDKNGNVKLEKFDCVLLLLEVYGANFEKTDDEFMKACLISKEVNYNPVIKIDSLKFDSFESFLIYNIKCYERKNYPDNFFEFIKNGNLGKYYKCLYDDPLILTFFDKLSKVRNKELICEVLYYLSEKEVKYYLTKNVYAINIQDVIDYLTLVNDIEKEAQRIYNDTNFTKWLEMKGYRIK